MLGPGAADDADGASSQKIRLDAAQQRRERLAKLRAQRSTGRALLGPTHFANDEH